MERTGQHHASQDNSHRFFDPKQPDLPESLAGLDMVPILKLGSVAASTNGLPYGAYSALDKLPSVARVMPLVERVSAGQELSPEDIRPYRKSIKRLYPKVRLVDTASVALSGVGVGVPMRHALNRRIERDFPEIARQALAESAPMVEKARADVEFLSGFDNPRQQFETEWQQLAETAYRNIEQTKTLRLNEARPAWTQNEEPRGIQGLFTKIVRSIKSFFGIFSRKKVENTREVSAYDVGAGLDNMVKSLHQDIDKIKESMPILSRFVIPKLPTNLSGYKDRLAFVAPEFLTSLFSLDANNPKYQRMLAEVSRNAHELRFTTRFKDRYGRISISNLQFLSSNFTPRLKAALPDDGKTLWAAYQHILNLTNVKLKEDEESDATKDSKSDPKALKKLWNKLRKRT